MNEVGKRLADFKTRFSNWFGPRAQGYDELDTLERPLVGDQDDDEYTHQQQEEGGQYVAPGGGNVPTRPLRTEVPSQAEELQEIAVLSTDAAEILWEMVVLGEQGEEMEDMRRRAEQLKGQLRGLLNDYSGEDETLLCNALEAFDRLTAALDSEKEGLQSEKKDDGNQEAGEHEMPTAEEMQQQQQTEGEEHDQEVGEQQREEEQRQQQQDNATQPPPLISFD